MSFMTQLKDCSGCLRDGREGEISDFGIRISDFGEQPDSN
jgi:hypothetical protein